jgi:hypothetical protein
MPNAKPNAKMQKPVAKPKTTSKAPAKKPSDPSDTKPFNIQLMKQSEIIKDKFKTKPATKTAPKSPAKKLVGPAAVAALKKQVSKAGAKTAIDKKYPGLYKK